MELGSRSDLNQDAMGADDHGGAKQQEITVCPS